MVTKEQLEALWYTEMTNDEIARKLGVRAQRIWEYKNRFGLPPRAVCRTKVAVDPDPETIERLCAEIQATWSPAERARRAGAGAGQAWMAPRMSVNRRGVFQNVPAPA